MTRYIRFSLLFSLFIATSLQAQTIWTQTNGPEAGAVPTICIDSLNHIFVGTEASGVYQSNNSGTSWIPRNKGLTTLHMLKLESSPKSFLFAIATDGLAQKPVPLFRMSREDGANWSPLDTTSTFGTITALACSPNSHVFIGTLNYGVLRSTNSGDTWEAANNGIDPRFKHVLSINASRSSVIAVTKFTDSLNHIFVRLYRSSDDGLSWNLLNDGPGGGSPSAILPLDDGSILYGNKYGNVYRLTPSSGTWDSVFADTKFFSGIYNLILNPRDRAIFLRTNAAELWKSTDNGLTWNYLSRETGGGDFFATAIDTNGVIYIGTDYDGLLRSLDGGYNFDLINGQFIASYLYAVAMDHARALYAIGIDNIWRTTDQGNTWKLLDFDIGEMVIEPPYAIDDESNLYIGNVRGVWVSRDSGETWTLALTAPNNNPLQCNQLSSANGHVYAAMIDGLYESPDHGRNWREIPQLEHEGKAHGTFAGRDGSVYAYMETGLLYRTTDDGINWYPLNGGNFLAATSSISTLFAINDLTIQRSIDSGGEWQSLTVPNGATPRKVNNMLLDSHNDLLAATDSGIFRSHDYGDTWEDVSAGLHSDPKSRLIAVTRICEDESTGIYYAASRGEGVYRSNPNLARAGVRPALPDLGFHLEPNYPNPFQQSTTIRFTLTEATDVEIEVRDLSGTLVWSYSERSVEIGDHTVPCDLGAFASGNYLCVLRTNAGSAGRWMTHTK